MGYLLDPKGATMAETTLDATLEETGEAQIQPQWELAECSCPDYCERDHEQD
jgi:hypothetical protein